MSVVVLVGNPKANSRTYSAATMVATQLCGRAPDTAIDLVQLGAGLLADDDRSVLDAINAVCSADVLIVASPTYRGTFTGLLKLFLDRLPNSGLAGVTAFPVMVGASPQHGLAPEIFLRPVLTELGANCPGRALFVSQEDYRSPGAVSGWARTHRPFLPVERVDHDRNRTS